MMSKIEAIDRKIKEMKKLAEGIMKEGNEIEAVKRNTKRILASIAMLECNVSDVKEVM
ncbi:MAG: hypothetical protein A4E64_01765 [Syntrophorhabdus sp. PtaU1.Bin058]|nr:MAG: hypothetical protein A4E64_01765 [Syntrophorhabdus sp. PtaU1.Bin058]